MKILVVGATGATGRLLVEQLLDSGIEVKAVVRNTDRIPSHLRENEKLKVISGNVLQMTDEEFDNIMKDYDGAASCLGHNISFRGIYGKPRRLVRDSVRKICRVAAKKELEKPFKFVLMSTVANLNRDLDEKNSIGEKIIFSILRIVLPPHPDNESAAEVLRSEVGSNSKNIEWVAVRPDTLTNKKEVTEYSVHQSIQRSVMFDSGKTSRINVANFMKELLTNEEKWNEWKFQMPVIYNEGE